MISLDYIYLDTPLYTLKLARTRIGQIFVITFLNQLRNDNWSVYYGAIQKILQTGTYRNIQFKGITFDLSSCSWIDPAPLMSILISANIYKVTFRGTINFKLFSFNQKYPTDSDKILKFLATEEFLKEIFKISDGVYFDKRKILDQETELQNLLKLDTKLNYSNCSVIPLCIVDTTTLFNNPRKKDNWLDDKLEEAKVGLIGKESELVIQDVLYKIKILLDETVQNIYEHAYDTESNTGIKERWAAIYLRFRYGTRNKTFSVEEREDLQDNIKKESQHCPRLESQFADENSGFVEIFILDGGAGISSSFVGKDKRIEFRNSVIQIMRDGMRKKTSKQKNMTARGGLNLIYDLLSQEKRDYICGHSDSEWIGDSVPFETSSSYFFNDPSKENSIAVTGLCWIFRISMNSNTILSREDWKIWEGNILENPAFLGYKDSPYSFQELSDFYVIDHRFSISESDKYNSPSTNKQDRVVVILAKPLITKITVWDMIDKALVNIPSLPPNNSRILIVGDIPEKEALIYTAALINANIYADNNHWKSKISDIVLITQKYYVCIVKKTIKEHTVTTTQKFTFEKNEEDTQKYVNADYFNPTELSNPAISIRDYINFLKSYDSNLFWSALSTHSLKDYLYINQKILWDDNEKFVGGYLNFSLTLTQHRFVQLYKLVLNRCYGLVHNKTAILRHVDELSRKLCEEFNNNSGIKNFSSHPILYIGSVYGSGSHELATIANFPKTVDDLIINFFIQSGSVAELRFRIALLYWPTSIELKKYNFPNPPQKFERIGKTYSIGPSGWKYFPIPRYQNDGQSFYRRNPTETYNDWQSINNPIVSYVNVSYQGFTDLIRVDLKKAIEYSFKYKTELSRFLVEQFAYVLKASKETDFRVADYYNAIKNSTESRLDLSDFYDGIGLIVYPNHLNTSIAIENIQNIFKENLGTNQLIPIDFTQSYHESNSYLIAPLTLERIKDAFKIQKERGNENVLFFDDTTVSGKTRKQIFHILKGLGVGNVKSLVILDRSRLPYNLPDRKEVRAYWRLDVPRLAYGSFNPIDLSLEKVNLLTPLFTEPAKTRFTQWKIAWGNNSLGIFDSGHGIEPSRLVPEKQLIKKFGISPELPHEQIGGNKNRIELVNSFGLCIYCAETHSMTGKDDVALQLIQKSSFPPSIIIELICSQLLLFPNDFSRELRLKMLMQMFQSSLSITESDNHTALAAVVLVAQSKNIISSLFNEIIQIQNIEESTVINLDLRMAIEYLVNKHDLKSLYKINTYDSILIKNHEDSLLQIYKRFHFEIYEGRGTMHSRPILEIFSSQPTSFQEKLKNAAISFSRLQSIFKEDIKKWFLRPSTNIFSEDIIEKMKECYKSCEEILKNNSTDENLIFSKKIQTKVVPFLQGVHDRLFSIIKNKDDSPLKRRFNEVVKELVKQISAEKWNIEATKKKIDRFKKNHPVILISYHTPDFPLKYNGYEKLWVIYDKIVEIEIKNLLYNAVYAGALFPDPHNPTDRSTLANMWIWIEYLPENVTLHFTNKFTDKFEIVKENIKKGYNDAHQHCTFEKALNGDFKIFPTQLESEELMSLTLSLPIV